ncbi:MAG: hypothetical protein IKD45_03865 [Clostridia bacterium]|nr:hypothetical protein [Clostridia bacterium]
MRIEDFLNEHKIVQIGNTTDGYVCCEIIVDNPTELIYALQDSNAYISEIRWWDRVKISCGSTIGYGGPRDPRASDEYFFAETDICKTYNAPPKNTEIHEYITRIKKEYCEYNLFPSFDIKKI